MDKRVVVLGCGGMFGAALLRAVEAFEAMAYTVDSLASGLDYWIFLAGWTGNDWDLAEVEYCSVSERHIAPRNCQSARAANVEPVFKGMQ